MKSLPVILISKYMLNHDVACLPAISFNNKHKWNKKCCRQAFNKFANILQEVQRRMVLMVIFFVFF